MYYLTHWEQILQYSTSPRDNLRLLKLINLAIEMNSKPFYVTGLKYFRVSLQAGLKVSEKQFQKHSINTSFTDPAGILLVLHISHFDAASTNEQLNNSHFFKCHTAASFCDSSPLIQMIAY